MLACGLLASCQTARSVADTTFSLSNFAGMAAADEPQAVLVGRDILNAGGTATDAAVAMAFTMTVTMPSQVSLGSAGACLVFDRGQKKVDAAVFLPRPAGDAQSLVPAMPRGLYLMHANYGHVLWSEILGPAQRIAQQGAPASRAFIRQFAPLADDVLADPAARALFARADGSPVDEGDPLRNPELGATIGRLALNGVGAFYAGDWSRLFIAAARQTGATFTEDDMRNFFAQSPKPVRIEYNHEVAYFAPAPAQLGRIEADAWTHLAETYSDAAPEARAKLVADALASQPDSPVVGASLVTVDGAGSAVVCEFTLNRPFGTGKLVPGFGTYLAAPGPDVGLGIGPMLVVNENSNEFRLGGGASGGPSGARAMLRAAAAALLDDQPLTDAIAQLKDDDSPGRVELARCTSGYPTLRRCMAATDPRGFGLAQSMAKR